MQDYLLYISVSYDFVIGRSRKYACTYFVGSKVVTLVHVLSLTISLTIIQENL